MKKFIKTVLAVITTAALVAGCNANSAPQKLKVGATSIPHAEILNYIKEDLSKKGVDMEVVEYGDYTLLNPSLNDGQIDVNFFQHVPYLDNYVKNSGQDLKEVAKIHIEPMGIYSDKIKSLDEITDGAIVGVPNDSTNEARALLLLEAQGLIKLKENVGFDATPNDVIDNPKNLQFSELDASVLPRTLSETTISVINTNYALEANLTPYKDSLAIEGIDSPYANVIVVRGKDKDSAAIKTLIETLQTDKVKDFINKQYEGSISPSF